MPPYPLGASNVNAPGVVATPTALARGESVYLFGTLTAGSTQLPPTPTTVTGESPAPPQASVAINVGDFQEGGPAPGVSFEGIFSGAPGAFEVDIQEADTDVDAAYILPTGSTAYKVTAVIAMADGTSRFRVDLIPTGGRFMRALLVSRANAVSLVIKATRLQ